MVTVTVASESALVAPRPAPLIDPRRVRPGFRVEPCLGQAAVSRGHVTTQSSRPVETQISPSPQRQLRLGLGGCHDVLLPDAKLRFQEALD